MAKVPTIAELQGMSDAELSEAFGFTAKIEQAKKALSKLDELKGKPRAEAEKRIQEMFTPHVWPDEFEFILKDVTRSKKEATLDVASPSEFFD